MKKILCIGGSGQLGKSVIKSLRNHSITNVDFSPSQHTNNNFLLSQDNTPSQNNQSALNYLKEQKTMFNAIMVTAGGWAPGSVKDEDYFQKCNFMFNLNLVPCLLAAHLSTKYLADSGLIIFTGAAAVFKEPQPDMIGYSLAKTGVHSLALNLSQKFLKDEKDQRVLTILPQTIGKDNKPPGADPDHIADLLKGWVEGLNVPNNGSFAVLKTKNGAIVPEFV